MSTLTVGHVASDPAQFEVRRVDGKTGPLSPVVSPIGFPVEGRPGSDLIEELRRYRETFPVPVHESRVTSFGTIATTFGSASRCLVLGPVAAQHLSDGFGSLGDI
jgi:hypothetical protein